MSLGCRLAAAEERAFQGRGAELRQAWRLLCSDDLLPRILRVHGPPGIGKTAFVYALARLCGDRGYPAVIIDSRDLRKEPAVLRDVIAERTAAMDGKPMLLALDTIEEMRDLKRPLWDELLSGLHENVLVVLSGRTPARCPDAPGMWHDLVDDLELGGLSQVQSRRLLRYHRILDTCTVASITTFAGGNPLFLTVAAEHARSMDRWDATQAAVVARSLIGRMTSEITETALREMLEAASLVRTFNQELLAAMIGSSIPVPAYRALCDLSVVREVPHGARLHDLVREAVTADLRWRSPAACHAMRQRAYRYLVRQAARSPDAGAYEQELLHLAVESSPLARFYVAAGHDGVRVRQAGPDDLPRLRELCRIGITRFGLPPGERAAQLDADFEAAQGLRFVAEEHDAITGFAYSVPLSRDTWRAAATVRGDYFASLPAAELARIKTAPAAAPQAVLATGTTHLPGCDHVNAALREALLTVGRDRCGAVLGAGFMAYYLVTTDSLELAEISAAGLSQRRTDIRLGSCLVDEWVLRLDGRDIVAWVSDALGICDAGPYAQQVPEHELADQVKVALEGIHWLERLEESKLTRLAQVRDQASPAVTLRKCLLGAIRDLEAAPALADRQAGAVLTDYYLNQVGSMELVADKLGLPRTTFYRRLSRGLTRVARRLRTDELTMA